ncbi:MAG: tetratricopeptide repeat protein [Porticoccaceae bacterium]|nr:tetratricopeptide repeat protein [Porticoccaceae bacterium]
MKRFFGLGTTNTPSLTTPAVALLFTLSGCTTLQQSADIPAADNSEQPVVAAAETVVKPKPPLKPFKPETLFDLLVADFAGANQQYGLQLNRYSKQAFATRDPGVVATATWLAIQLSAAQQALELSQLWVEIAPEDTDANRIAGYYLASGKQLARALPHALQALRADDKEAGYAIVRQLQQASAEQHQQLHHSLKTLTAPGGRFDDLANNPHVVLLDARLLLQQGDHSAAIARAATVQQPETERDTALLLTASAILEKDGLDANLAHLEQSVAQHPNSKRLRLQLAKQWAEKDVERSRAELVKLVEQFPDDPRLVNALAMFNMAKKFYPQAQPLFEQLLDTAEFKDNAHFQLGRIHEQAERHNDAIEHYRQVQPGEHYNTAIGGQIRLLAASDRDDDLNQLVDRLLAMNPRESAGVYLDVAAILASNQHTHKALALLNTALDKHPQNGDLLYNRSMLYEQQGDTHNSHIDLRAIIALRPDNANALNALGYSLSNSDDPADYLEAHQLVSQALKLDPENPAILDSMGWALFRLQRLEEALPHLRRAFELFPDPEVAAHLGEVLWQMGQRTEALDIWEQSLADNQGKPGTRHVEETMKRLGATRVSQNQP